MINGSRHRSRPKQKSGTSVRVESAGDVSDHQALLIPTQMSELSEKSTICTFELITTWIHWSSQPRCIILPDTSAASAYVHLRPPKWWSFWLNCKSQRRKSFKAKKGKKWTESIRILVFLPFLFSGRSMFGVCVSFHKILFLLFNGFISV